MNRLNATQIADLTRRCTIILEQMKQVCRADNNTETRDTVRGILYGIRDLVSTYQQPGIGFAVRAWFDAVIEVTPGVDIGRGQPTSVVILNEQHTDLVNPRQVSAEHKWATDALAARISDDQTELYRLLGAMPSGDHGAVCLFRAVEIAASTMVSYETPPAGTIKPGIYTVRSRQG